MDNYVNTKLIRQPFLLQEIDFISRMPIYSHIIREEIKLKKK